MFVYFILFPFIFSDFCYCILFCFILVYVYFILYFYVCCLFYFILCFFFINFVCPIVSSLYRYFNKFEFYFNIIVILNYIEIFK